MIQFIRTWLELKTDRRAVTAIEYAVVAALVVTGLATVFSGMGAQLSTKINAIVTSIT